MLYYLTFKNQFWRKVEKKKSVSEGKTPVSFSFLLINVFIKECKRFFH